MSVQVQFRRGSTSEHNAFTGGVGEITVDTTKDTAVVHDGAVVGGVPLLREDLGNLPAGTIDNADVNASAAIAGTKISPNFGAQTITTTGVFSSALGSAATPSLTFTGDLNTGIFSPGADQVAISTNGAGQVFVNNSGVGVGKVTDFNGLSVINDSTTASRIIGVTGTDYSTNFRSTFIRYFDTAATGTTAGISNTQLGALAFQNTSNALIYTNGGTPLIFATLSAERLRITSAGLVGIGTSAFASGAGQGTGVSAQVNGSLYLYEGNNAPSHGGAVAFGVNALSTYTPMAQIKGLLEFAAGTELQGGIGIFTRPLAGGAEGQTLQRRVTIKSDGSVGIGTTSPATTLDVNGDVTITDKIIHGGDTNTAIRFPAADTVSVETNGADRARIDSSGRLLVGTSSALTSSSSRVPRIQVTTGDTNNSGILLGAFSAGSGRSQLNFLRSKSSSIGTNTVVVSGEALGEISWNGADGTNYIRSAEIRAEVDGTPGANNMPGRLVFSTATNASPSAMTERMRIISTGHLLFNHTNTSFPGIGNTNTGLTIESPASGASVFISRDTTSLYLNRNSNGGVQQFSRSGTAVGSISVTTIATAYNTSSDYRLKENITTLDGAIARLNQLPVHRFNFIADPDTVVDGFIAHEAQEVVPECVTGTKDEVDEDGNPVYQGIDPAKLVPLLTAALQEAIGEIESLKKRVLTLESK